MHRHNPKDTLPKQKIARRTKAWRDFSIHLEVKGLRTAPDSPPPAEVKATSGEGEMSDANPAPLVKGRSRAGVVLSNVGSTAVP